MIHHGDCVEVMAGMPEASVDAIVTDPPYGLEFMGKEWDRLGVDRRQPGDATFHPSGVGPFDRAKVRYGYGDGIGPRQQQWHAQWATAALRVARPGAYLLAFGGTRTVHRMTVALEDAGWVIRDMLVWAYASGFPKSRALLKPAWEPIVMARKPGPLRELDIDGCRIGTTVETWPASRAYSRHDTGSSSKGTQGTGDAPAGRWPANIVLTATEWYTLRHDVGQQVREVITSYFEALGVGVHDVPGLREGVRDNASVGTRRTAEVLLPAVQLEGIAGGQANGHAPHAGVTPEDARGDDGASGGSSLARLERRQVPRPARLRVGVSGDANGAGPGAGDGDGPEAREGSALRSGAPAGDGADARPATGAARGSASPQRGEGRQQSGQPVPQGPVEPHPRASDDRPGTGTTPRASRRAGSRERGVTVPLDLIPAGWRQYFVWSYDSGIFDGDTEGVVGGGWTESTSAVGAWKPRGAFPIDNPNPVVYGDAGTYSRFFLVPKASRSDREPVLPGMLEATQARASIHSDPTAKWADKNPNHPRRNVHPTVKPVELMRHLVRLVTPADGTVLDPFLGSGTTAIAAEQEGRAWVGIEREAEYVAIAEARLVGTQRGLGLDVA